MAVARHLVDGEAIVGLALGLRSLQGARVGFHRKSMVVLHVLHVAAPAPPGRTITLESLERHVTFQGTPT